MKTMLISGGSGDWAQSFVARVSDMYDILTPGRDELDVADRQSVADYMSGRDVDVLINNAGCIHPKRILDSEPEDWIRDINVNFVGAYLLSKAVLHNTPGAVILNMSSMAGFGAYPDWSSYCSSKAAMITFSKCLANDGYASYCLCPGGFDTKFRGYFDLDNSNLMSSDEVSDHVLDILDGKYAPGDVLAFRKGYFKLNPAWDL